MVVRNNETNRWERKGSIEEDLAVIGGALTEAQLIELDNIALRLNNGNSAAASALITDTDFTLNVDDTEARTLFQLEHNRAEAAVGRRLTRLADDADAGALEFAAMAGSKELIALTSLAYNSPSLIGTGLATAIVDGNRAEAWFEIRYRSNLLAGKQILGLPLTEEEQQQVNQNIDDGLAKRRYYESQVFGLYNSDVNSVTITTEEALEVYRMYTEHQRRILEYERRYGSGSTDNNQIAAANSDYQLGTAEHVQTFQAAIQPAYDGLWIEYGEDAITIDYRDIQVAAEEGSFLEGHRRDGWTLSDTAPEVNDLLIGRDGNDILDGCSGENWLYGGEGDDTYTLKGDGNSINHIIDNDGNNRLILNGSVVADAIEAGNGTWTSLDGRFSFTRNSPLTITDNQTGDTIIVADHQDGEYGIHLRENANLQRIYGKKIHGDLDPQDFAPVAIANSGGHALNWKTAA
jgi:Ca2+-binding RTX toxin-like protein